MGWVAGGQEGSGAAARLCRCNYRAEYFDKAVQIAVAYFRAANDYCTQMEARPATYEEIRKAFWKKILRADLLSPLEDAYALAVSAGAP